MLELAGRPEYPTARRRGDGGDRGREQVLGEPEAAEAGERLKELAERRLDDRVYPDRLRRPSIYAFGGHHVLAALRAWTTRATIREGAEAVVALALLVSLVERGLGRWRFDGSKALRRSARRERASCTEPQDWSTIADRPSARQKASAPCCGPPGTLGAKDGKARIEQVRVLGGEAASGRGGTWRELHRQGDRADPGATAVPRQEPTSCSLGNAPPHGPRDPVERRVHAVRWRSWTPRRIPQDHGLQGPLDLKAHLDGRHSGRGGCRVA